MGHTKTFDTIVVQNSCCESPDDCSPQSMEAGSIGRRGSIQATSLSAALLLPGRSRVMAGPFLQEDFEQIIPADKKLTKQWERLD